MSGGLRSPKYIGDESSFRPGRCQKGSHIVETFTHPLLVTSELILLLLDAGSPCHLLSTRPCTVPSCGSGSPFRLVTCTPQNPSPPFEHLGDLHRSAPLNYYSCVSICPLPVLLYPYWSCRKSADYYLQTLPACQNVPGSPSGRMA